MKTVLNKIRNKGRQWSIRDRSGYMLSQYETALQCNVICHWLSPCPEWSMVHGLALLIMGQWDKAWHQTYNVQIFIFISELWVKTKLWGLKMVPISVVVGPFVASMHFESFVTTYWHIFHTLTKGPLHVSTTVKWGLFVWKIHIFFKNDIQWTNYITYRKCQNCVYVKWEY